jgi:hypothetical protein
MSPGEAEAAGNGEAGPGVIRTFVSAGIGHFAISMAMMQ